MTRPLGGTWLYSLRRCCALPMAASTDCLLTRDLMFEAVPISSASILEVRLIWPLGGMTSEIMEVPLPRASWRPLTSCWEDEREKKGVGGQRRCLARDRSRGFGSLDTLGSGARRAWRGYSPCGPSTLR